MSFNNLLGGLCGKNLILGRGLKLLIFLDEETSGDYFQVGKNLILGRGLKLNQRLCSGKATSPVGKNLILGRGLKPKSRFIGKFLTAI